MTPEELNALGTKVLEAAYRVHTAVGPGLLESAYVACLVHELRHSGLSVKTEVPVPVVYGGEKLADVGYRIDILVENEVIIEVKSLESIAPVHVAQLVSYLKLAERRLGYVLNFNVEHLKAGIHRCVNDCRSRGELLTQRSRWFRRGGGFSAPSALTSATSAFKTFALACLRTGTD